MRVSLGLISAVVSGDELHEKLKSIDTRSGWEDGFKQYAQ